MGRVPAFLLVHACTVEDYRSWGVYGPQRRLRCFINEALSSAGPAGTERVAQVTIVTFPGQAPPAGSRVTLAGGRKGYAHAVVRHDGGGLPTPDHDEIAMTIAESYGPAFGETVVLLTRTTRRDAAGSTRYSVRETPVADAAVRLIGSSESALGSAQTQADTVEVILPPGTPITTTDQMRVRGLLYDVDGTPEEVSDPTTTARPGVKVIGKRRQQ
jgi:hypothetical protein